MFTSQWKWFFSSCLRNFCGGVRRPVFTNTMLNKQYVHPQFTFLIETLNMARDEAKTFAEHKIAPDMSTERLAMAVAMLMRLGFSKEEICACPDVLLVLPASIQQHTLVLREGGFPKVTAHSVVRYLKLVKKRVSLLKAYGLVPQDVDVTHSMLAHLEEGPGPLQSLGDSVSFTAIQVAVVKHYLCWRLDMSPANADIIMKTYPRIKNKSLRLITQTLDILENELGFSRDKIKNNGYLIHSHPDNTLRMMKELPHIRGVPFKDIVSLHPKIVMSRTDSLLCTLQYLEEFGISDEAVRRNPQIFTLGSKTVRKRLEMIHTLPGLTGLQEHPRVLRLVHYLHKARARLSQLDDMHVKCASLHLLCGTQSKFKRYTRDGGDRTKGVDIIYYLSSVLGRQEEDIRSHLHKHPYWCHVPLPAVTLTYEYLLQRGYTTHDIYCNVHLLLYPRDRVAAELGRLWQRSELHTDAFTAARGDTTLPPAQELALCLYFLEKEYHFTGDGVWVGLSPVATSNTSSDVGD